jgi:hypothetical protein
VNLEGAEEVCSQQVETNAWDCCGEEIGVVVHPGFVHSI